MDPDPVFQVNPSFGDQKLEKIQFNLFYVFFYQNLQFAYKSLSLRKGRPSERRSLQSSKENIQDFKGWKWTVFYFSGPFLPSWIKSHKTTALIFKKPVAKSYMEKVPSCMIHVHFLLPILFIVQAQMTWKLFRQNHSFPISFQNMRWLETVGWWFSSHLFSDCSKVSSSVGDPDPEPDPQDPRVFGPSGSGSSSRRYGSGSFFFLINVWSGLK